MANENMITREKFEKIEKVVRRILEGISSDDRQNAISWTNSSKIGEISDEQISSVITELGLDNIEQKNFVAAIIRHSLAGAEVTNVSGCGELEEVLKKIHSVVKSKMN